MPIRSTASLATRLTTFAVITTGILASSARADWTGLNGELIASGPSYQYGSVVESDGVGGAYLAWRDGPDTRITRVRKDGTAAAGWDLAGRRVRTDIATAGFPALLADGPDGVYVTFSNATDPSLHETRFSYVQRFQGNGRIAPGWPEQGLVISQSTGGTPFLTTDDVAVLVSDGHHGVFVLGPSAGGVEAFVLGQHVDSHAHPLWGDTPRTIVAGTRAFTAKADEQGGLLVAVQFPAFAAPPRALRVDADGQVHAGWPADGREFTHLPAVGSANLVADDRGGALLSFTTGSDDPTRNGRDVYAQHVTAEGAIDPAWADDGLPLATGPGEQTSRGAVTDDAGGAIFFWVDHRPGTRGFDIWGQRITGDGRVLWAAGGQSLVSVAGNEAVTDAVADGSGGAFFVWADLFSIEQDVLMSRIDATGAIAPGWPVEGLPISDTAGNEIGAQIAYCAPFDPIVAWDAIADPSVSDVVAARVAADGSGSTPAAGAAHGLQRATPAVLASTAVAPGVVVRGRMLELSLPAAGATRIDLFDLGGRRVASQDAGFLTAGSHTVELAAGRALRSGLYFVQVSQAGRRWTSRLSLMR